MVREIITVNVGQCGIQLGTAVWEQYCAEHKINEAGVKTGGAKDDTFRTFFEATAGGKFKPRNLSVDLEENVINNVKSSKYSAIFPSDYLLAGKEDAANNFARGHYTVGKMMIDQVNAKLGKLVENCDNLQGFIMNHGIGGGTGSGLGMLTLERIAVDYRKKSKLAFSVYPSPTTSICVYDAYNALLSTHWLLDHTEIDVLLDNAAIYDICKQKLDIKLPSYDNLNRLCTKVISSMTASLRFDGELEVDLNEYQTNLVPFPRLHFMMTSMSPMFPKNNPQNIGGQGIIDECFSSDNFLTKIADFDEKEDKYMAVCVNFRGDVNSKEANARINTLRTNEYISFVEWCPTGFKIGLNEQIPAELPQDVTASYKRQGVMIGNNVAISRVFKRYVKQYDLMYSERAFVHWFIGEGMEEGEFAEAREDLKFLEKDYQDVLSEQDGGDDDF